MGKVKGKEGRRHSNHQDDPKNRKRGIVRRDHSHAASQRTKPKGTLRRTGGTGTQQRKLEVPFVKQDRVLLVGEGDFSFAHSLAKHHKIGQMVATCYDSEADLHLKYPRSKDIILDLLKDTDTRDVQNGSRTVNGQVPGEVQHEDEEEEDSEQDRLSSSSGMDPAIPQPSAQMRPAHKSTTFVKYGANATKLSTSHKKMLRPFTPFTKIVFNFPHVGGLSTDVNRQVRSNQELLVGFFNAAKGLLASEANQVPRFQKEQRPDLYGDEDDDHDDDNDDDYDMDGFSSRAEMPTNGQILLTIFEGEPYTLWNVRDLARHCNLKVVRSFKFPWEAYPGYQHARTVGDITGGKDRSDEGKRKGAWRGEERDARCYVLEVNEIEAPLQGSGGNQVKLGTRMPSRKKSNDDDDGDESD